MNTHETLDRSEDIKTSSDRSFGIVFSVFFAIIGLAPLFTSGTVRIWALAVSLVFLVVALLLPRALSPLNRLWTRFGLLLHKVTNPLIMGLVFYLVIMPFGLVFKILGKDPLRRRFNPSASSYWVPREPYGPPSETMKNQF